MTQSIEKPRTNPATNLGLVIALAAPLLYSLLVEPFFLRPFTTQVGNALIGFAFYWSLVVILFAISRFAENKPVASLGIKPLSWRMVALAVGIGILLTVAVPLLTLFAAQVFPTSETGGIVDTATAYPAWVILLSVLTAGITEEVLFRAYPIERLLQFTGNPWISALLSLVVFVFVHATGWNLGHILGVVLPLGAVLTGLYLWQRNLIFVVIVHLLVDLPLVFLSLGG